MCISNMEVERDSRPTIEDLPHEILANMLRRIQRRKDRENITLVCRKWCSFERSSRRRLRIRESFSPPGSAVIKLVRRYVNLTRIHICYESLQQRKTDQVDNFCCRCIALGCEKLMDLRLSNCKYVSDVGMANIALCPELKAICLTDLPRVSRKGLLSLVTECLSLRLLHITELNNLKDAEWLQFVGMQRQIESLGITDCRGFEETQLGTLGSRGWRNLQAIIFCGDVDLYNRDPQGQLQDWRFDDPEGTEYCPNLKVAEFAFCLSMSGTGLFWMLAQCKALRRVRIKKCLGVEDDDIRLLAKNNPQLSFLSLTIPGPEVANMSLIHIAENLCNLERLSLGYTTMGWGMLNCSECGIVAIVESCTRLTTLILTEIFFLGKRTMTSIGCSPSLSDVRILGCEHLNDEMVLLVGLNLTKLQLVGCPQLTDESLDNFGTPHGRLEFLRKIVQASHAELQKKQLKYSYLSRKSRTDMSAYCWLAKGCRATLPFTIE